MPEPKRKEKQGDVRFEEEVLRAWDAEPGLYAYDPAKGPTYVIDTPPPYPSGEPHPGQVIHYSLIDMGARAQRMLGKAVYFPMGLDRNGINVERTVERKYKKPLHAWDRAEFIAKCRQEITAIGEGILRVFQRMGMTMDFAHTYYTDRDDYRASSQAIFIDLLNACRAVIVHPDDGRWRDAAGKTARVPIFGGSAPVRPHPEARVDFGSG